MSASADLVVRGGTVVDGSGREPLVGDVAISGGRFVQIGGEIPAGIEEIDATGLLVTPGFVDIHTHYDGQVTWDRRTQPSASHGVTTAVMGNCGVGFAPCRPKDRGRLISLMSGVEDIPEAVMSEGLPWNWETFPEFLDAVASMPRDIDIAAQLPHAPLRVYVMGDRAVAGESATGTEMAEMGRLAEEAIRAGAIGFATSRSLFHRDRQGGLIPTRDADSEELLAIAGGLAAAGRGVIEIALDDEDYVPGLSMIRRLAERSGGGVSFNLFQLPEHPAAWRHALALTEQANLDGLPIKAQFLCRPTGLLLGLNLSFNNFSFSPHYQAIAHLPLPERVAEMRRPEVRAAILNEQPSDPNSPLLAVLQRFQDCFALGDPPNYEPEPGSSIEAIAKTRGVRPQDIAYDMLLADEGKALLFAMVANYADRNLDTVMTMFKHPNTILGLGDGGAHCGVICDAGYPTFMLTYWTRDRDNGERLGLAEVVKALSWDTAQAVGLLDRGLIAPGYKADLNLIDYDRLHLGVPQPVFDLPNGGRRLLQKTTGFVRTLVNGVTTYRDGVATGALPGRLVRGPVRSPLTA